MTQVEDKYFMVAEYYDHMLTRNLAREAFFNQVFQKYHVQYILDCACGTGNDLLLFNSMGYTVAGSDVSESILQVSRKKALEKKVAIPIQRVDFHDLQNHYSNTFDAIVCLSNAINEVEVDVNRALESMKSVLKPGGIIIFDQGQTDSKMRNPPRYSPIVNNQHLSRLFTMDYANDIMTVHIFDFIHKEKEEMYDFRHSEHKIRIRLYNDWKKILGQVQLDAEYYGNWNHKPYDVDNSERLIVVARKRE